MTSIGKYKIKKEVDNKGFFCDIEIHISKIENSKTILIFNESVFDPKWKSAIEYGVSYFFEHYETQGWSIEVFELKTMIGDSKLSVVCYSTIKALCDAFDFKIKGLELQENGSFSFPK